ncbi:MAG: hypothetical protein Q9190_001644 [Brigantiaea leucoxantha]
MTDTNDPSKHSEVRAAPFKHAQSFNSKTPQPVSLETKHVWKFRLRPDDDNAPQDWWFASTAIPLLAATSGPLANVMSIAALVTSWRNDYNPQYPGVDTQSVGYPDPRWCIALNAASLYVPPRRPDQTYSQGFWHAVIAAALYLLSSMALMVNMLGYFLGHYPQHFELSDEQRNLILQTMLFFIWLAGGAGVFAKVDPGWQYVDALYFCDVIGGIVILGLLVSSILKFAKEISHDKIVKSHAEKRRVQTIDRSVTSLGELEELRKRDIKAYKVAIPLRNQNEKSNGQANHFADKTVNGFSQPAKIRKRGTMRSGVKRLRRMGSRKPKLVLLQEEKDRFEAMRNIQKSTSDFKRYSALAMSALAFVKETIRLATPTPKPKCQSIIANLPLPVGLLWCVGAVGFWQTESKSQGLSYFQALYFCYVSLTTIGYGDLSPSSNAGKPFFIVWSLLAVPTMTVLISDMGNTVIASFKRGTFTLADWTVLPKAGMWRNLAERHPWLLNWLQTRAAKSAADKRIAEGFPTGDDLAPPPPAQTLQDLVHLETLDTHALARKLSSAIRRTANDIKASPPRDYTFEEWAEHTRLIRFSRMTALELEEEEEDEGLVEWDWIGRDSPMMAEQSESEWLLDRLCESLDRYMRREERQRMMRRREGGGKGG